MALQKEIVGIGFVGGLETKADEKTVLPTKLTHLDNGEFTKRGTVRARPGHFALPDASLNGSASAAILGTKLAHATRADELLLVTDQRLYSQDETASRWIDKGPHFPLTYTSTELAQVNASQSYSSIATAGNVRAVIWEDSRGGVRYSLYNASTGAAYVVDQVIAASNASRPYAVPVGNNVMLLWAEHSTNEIRGQLILGHNILASVAAAYVPMVQDLDATRKYAVTVYGTDLYFAYHADGTVVAAGIGYAKVNTGGVTAWKVSVSTDTPTCLDIAHNASTDKVDIIWYSGALVKYSRIRNTLVFDVSGSTLNGSANVVRVAVSPSYTETNGELFAHAWEVDAATDDINTVYIANSNPVVDSVRLRHCHLVSSGFRLQATGPGCFILGHASRTGLQNAYYLYDENRILLGQFSYQNALGRPAADHLTRCFDNQVALGFKRQLDVEGTNAVFTHSGVSLVAFNTAPTPKFAEAGDTTYLTGSLLWAYDGHAVAEANPLMYPDMVDTPVVAGASAGDFASSTTGPGLLTPLQQYTYRVYYEFRRANGERVRSASLTRSITMDATDDTVTITIPTLGHTHWRDDLTTITALSDVTITVFRTTGNDTSGIYYKVSGNDPATVTGSNRYIYNDPTADTVSFIDELADTAIVSQEVDYLSRGELENIPCPGPTLLATVGDRVFAAGGGVADGTIRYSKLRFQGEPAEFSDLLVVDDLPEGPGNITSLSYVNETLVALRERGIAAVAGIGVDNTGTSGGFESQAVTTDVGCSGVTVVTPQGIMFTTSKGIYLLDQSFNVSYIGAPAERYNAQTWTGACVIPTTNQVVFTTSDTTASARSLMFDYHFNEWSSWTLQANDLVLWKGTIPVYLRTADLISLYRDNSAYDDAIFTDAGSTYDFSLRTGPIRLQDCLQGFARLRRFQVLGTYRSPHQLLVDLYYDRDGAPYESITWDPSTVIDPSTWGSDTAWGSGSFWGGSRDGNTYQFEHKPKRQKFSTIRFGFSMIPGTTPGAGYEITELALECGVKPGLQRHAVARKY